MLQFRLVLFILLIIFSTSLFSSDIADRFFYAKKNYITAVLKNDKKREILYLKQLIKYGKALGKDVSKYKKELRKLDKNIKKPKKIKKKITTDKKYTIKSVYTDGNSIVINFNHKVSKRHIKYFESKSKSRYFDIFDIAGNFKDAAPTKLKIDGVDRIKIVQYRYKTLRISISHRYNLKTYYIINKRQIIIKVKPKSKATKTITPKKYIHIGKKDKIIDNTKVIVIDAGHGGKDSGAIGPKRKYEKIVTLNIAKYLYKNLKNRGYKVYLTRDRDKYISLRYRTRFANKKNADIFISIHANAVRKERAKKAKGIETYFLSPARSERAKRVAALENKGDIDSMGYSSQNILLTLLNRSKIVASQKLAIDIQKHMLYNLRKYYGKKIVDGGVREGPFWVLVGAQMPAVLVEVGYISHPTESKRIMTKSYQQRIAKGIANGILSYFINSQIQ